MKGRITSLFSTDTRGTVIEECRRCGMTAESAETTCRACGSDDIVSYTIH